MIEKPNSNRGQTIIEFALLLVTLLILILGIFEFSIIMYDRAVLTYASREGARAAVVYIAAPDPYDPASRFTYSPLTEAKIKAAVNNYAQSRLVTFGAPFDATAAGAVEIVWRDKSGNVVSAVNSREGEIDVLVKFEYTFLALPRLGALGDGTLDLESRTIMRME